MSELRLIIGNRNYSSWSLRGGLLVSLAADGYSAEVIPLDRPDTRDRILSHSRAGQVPILVDGDVTVWDTYSIAEYLAERFPEKRLWPEEPKARAYARSISAEMHSGFNAMRSQFPMNIRKTIGGHQPSEQSQADIDRICAIWQMSRARIGKDGPYLFGAFSAADAFFAPVASRFRTYEIEVDRVSQDYIDAVFEWPAMRAWVDAAIEEPWVIASEEKEPAP